MRRSDAGYSFIEVFIAILIIALISSIIYINSSRILESIGKGSRELSRRYDLTNLIVILDREAQRVTTPWFLNSHKVEKSGSSIKLYYYNGDVDSYLLLESGEHGITISNSSSTLFSSKNLIGSFTIEGSTIIYTQGDIELKFQLGVTLA